MTGSVFVAQRLAEVRAIFARLGERQALEAAELAERLTGRHLNPVS